MTSNGTAYDRQYDKTVPTDSPEVARIMRERGVGRRRATHLATRAAAENIDVSSVDMSQKELVLTTLVKHDDIKNSDDLGEYLRRTTEVNHTDGHDVVKMLWACQKMGWVTFRERKSNTTNRPPIYAIRVTDKGYSKGYSAAANIKRDSVVPPAYRFALSAQSAKRLDGDPPPTYDEPPTDIPFRSRLINLDGYPLIKGLMDRAEKGALLANAAQILERAGEEDLALAVMEKNQFTPLEGEVARFVTRFRPVNEKEEK